MSITKQEKRNRIKAKKVLKKTLERIHDMGLTVWVHPPDRFGPEDMVSLDMDRMLLSNERVTRILEGPPA